MCRIGIVTCRMGIDQCEQNKYLKNIGRACDFNYEFIEAD